MQAPRNVDELVRAIEDGWTPKFVCFWGHTPKHAGVIGKECLSQWYPAPFDVDGVRYATAEHFMMASKARLFGDRVVEASILAAATPGEAKALGRSVRGFEDEVWDAARFEIVVRGSVAKFEQNDGVRGFLVGTGERVLVEASPTDRVWGVGLTADDRRVEDPREWLGLNLLGFALMVARARLGG